MEKQSRATFCLFDVLEFVESNLDMVKSFVEAYRAVEDALLLSGKFDSLGVRQNGKRHMFCPLCSQICRNHSIKSLVERSTK